jgi:hypothetical protein
VVSIEAAQPGELTEVQSLRLGEDRRGYHWVVFAAVMLLLAGTSNLVDGIGAIGGSDFFSRHANYIVGDLTSLGWTVLLLGGVQVLAGFGVLRKDELSRWVGVGSATLNALAQLLIIEAYPFWSLALFALDILVMYGLIVYGGQRSRSA